jgi:hypothetical protein
MRPCRHRALGSRQPSGSSDTVRARMVVRRLSCRAPSGTEFPIVLLGDRVIAPETVYQEPGLAWLELERLPRLSMEASQYLERVIDGLRIGCWPFCAPVARWNRAADLYPCLTVPIDGEAAYEVRSSELRAPRQGDPMNLPGEPPQAGPDMTIADRLLLGSRGVVELFAGSRHLLGLAGIGLALAACVYYVLGTAGWLWSLRDGITSGEVQNGLVLVLAALLFSGITRTLRDRRATPKMPMLTNVDRRDRQLVLYLLPDIYRAGVTLQLLGFLGFAIW